LDSLVASRTITQDQEIAIQNAFEAAMKLSKPQAKNPGTSTLGFPSSCGYNY